MKCQWLLVSILLFALTACAPTPAPSLPPAQVKPTLAPPVPAPTQVPPSTPAPATKPNLPPNTLAPATKPGLPTLGAQKPPAATKPGANITPPSLPKGIAKTHSVTNPTTNAKLHVQVFAPKNASRLPALVLVPGGTGDSGGFVDDALQMVNTGIVAVIFDPDGRGKSTGHEDYNGAKHQDGLAAVIRFAATLPEVDAQRLGVATYSYGITMGSGTLARYGDLPVKFLIDWEGPADRHYTTTGCQANRPGGIQWQPCNDQAWWAEREAVNFIGKIRVPYQRIQSEKDHVQINNNHALDLINAAIRGGVPWVRLNALTPNQTYDAKNPPPLLPESQDRQLPQTVIQFAQELFKK